MEEKELYLPVKELLSAKGFDVYGEVKTVDVVAQMGEHIIAVELKKELSLHLMAQGAKRQGLTDFVYVAIPTPTTKVQRGSAFQDKLYLMKRLGIGLIFVNLKKKPYKARFIMEPHIMDIVASQRRNKKKRQALQKEMAGRHRDYNLGGTNGKIMTAYKESSLRMIHYMQDGSLHKGAEIRKALGIENATQILYANHNGWFDHPAKGVYQLSKQGYEALKQNADFIDSIL